MMCISNKKNTSKYPDTSIFSICCILVPTRFPFRPNKSESHNEHIVEDDEEVYHRRIVHFELSSEHTHATSSNTNTQMRKYRRESSSNAIASENRRFGWDHRDFMQSVDP